MNGYKNHLNAVRIDHSADESLKFREHILERILWHTSDIRMTLISQRKYWTDNWPAKVYG